MNYKLRKSNHATILIITLWIITVLSTVALSLIYRMRLELQLTRAEDARVESFFIAEAGIVQAINVLNKDTNNWDSLSEQWSNYSAELYGINLFQNISVGRGVFNVSYVYGRDIFTGAEEMFYGMEDENRKINVNKATQDMLESLPGVTNEVASSIRAWRGDPEVGGDILLKEDTYYQGLSKPYERKGKEIEHLEELLLVRGVTPELLFGKDLDENGLIDINETGLSQYITVYGDGLVNINTASITVLRAIGFTEDLNYKILLYREGFDEVLGTEDDGIFTDKNNIGSNLSFLEPLLPDEEQLIEDKKDLLTVNSRYFTTYVQSEIPGKAKSNVRAVLDKEAEEGSQIIKWVEE